MILFVKQSFYKCFGFFEMKLGKVGNVVVVISNKIYVCQCIIVYCCLFSYFLLCYYYLIIFLMEFVGEINMLVLICMEFFKFCFFGFICVYGQVY